MHGNTKYKIRENWFDEIDNEAKAYVLGLLFADGCNNTDKYHSVSITLKENDKHILDTISKLIYFKKRPLYYKKSQTIYSKEHDKKYICSPQYTLQIINKHISSKLNEHGMIKNKTNFIKFPTCISKRLHKHFIRGFFDGDGCITCSTTNKKSARKDYICGILSNLYFLKSIQKIILESTNLHGSIISHVNVYRYQIQGNRRVEIFFNWIYKDATIFLKRKHKVFLQVKKANRCVTNKRYSNYKDITYCKKTKKYIARITINKKRKHIGRFRTEIEAHQARLKYELLNAQNQNTV
jgi:hypothetical protein